MVNTTSVRAGVCEMTSTGRQQLRIAPADDYSNMDWGLGPRTGDQLVTWLVWSSSMKKSMNGFFFNPKVIKNGEKDSLIYPYSHILSIRRDIMWEEISFHLHQWINNANRDVATLSLPLPLLGKGHHNPSSSPPTHPHLPAIPHLHFPSPCLIKGWATPPPSFFHFYCPPPIIKG